MVVIKVAELVKIVERGYQVVGRTENGFIPASDLIPFGRLQEFPGNTTFEGGVNLTKRGAVSEEQEKKVGEAARQYADRMGAPYFELDTERNITPGGLTGGSLERANILSRARVQLYVENKPQQRGQEVKSS